MYKRQVEHALGDRPGAAGGPEVVLDEVLGTVRGVAEGTRDQRPLAHVGGDAVTGPAAHQHDGVADLGGEPPGLGEPLLVGRGQQPGPDGGAQGLQRAGGAQLGHVERVPELDQLRQPLDVRQPAPAELGVQQGVGAPGQPLGLHAGLQPADLADGGVADAVRRVPQRLDEGRELGPELGIARREAGAEQGLRLPRRRPAAVVRRVRRQGADQGALTALRPQVGVDLQRRVRCGPGQQAAHLVGHRVRRVGRDLLVRARMRRVDEHHIGVAAVRGLVSAEAPHGDHREAGGEVAAPLQ